MNYDKIKEISDLLKENLPTLLSSKKGLFVACSVWNIIEPKDRKVVLKAFKDIMKETFTNKIAHLFICHMILTLDDTILTKRKLITPLMMNLEESINDPCF